VGGGWWVWFICRGLPPLLLLGWLVVLFFLLLLSLALVLPPVGLGCVVGCPCVRGWFCCGLGWCSCWALVVAVVCVGGGGSCPCVCLVFGCGGCGGEGEKSGYFRSFDPASSISSGMRPGLAGACGLGAAELFSARRRLINQSRRSTIKASRVASRSRLSICTSRPTTFKFGATPGAYIPFIRNIDWFRPKLRYETPSMGVAPPRPLEQRVADSSISVENVREMMKFGDAGSDHRYAPKQEHRQAQDTWTGAVGVTPKLPRLDAPCRRPTPVVTLLCLRLPQSGVQTAFALRKA